MKKNKKSIAMILYYEWSSDGRSKAAKDIYNKLGYEIQVFSTKENYITDKEGLNISWGIRKYQGESFFLFLLFHIIFMLQASLWLVKVIVSKNIVLIHIHNMPDYLVFVGLIGRLFRKKLIWDVRDITPAVWFSKKNNSSQPPSGFGYSIMVIVQHLSGLIASFILCADKLQKEYLINNGLNSKKLRIFMNFPLKDVFHWIGPSVDKEKFKLVYHGTISYRLGLDIAIEAIQIIKKDIPIISFHIVGSGEYSKDLEILIRDKKLEKYISLSPKFIPIEEIPKWVKGAAGAIIPNRRTYVTENFMLAHKMFEYISMGIPIILPKLKILTSYIKNDEAIFYEPDDAVDLARAIKELYFLNKDQMAQNAIKFFDRNSVDENEKVLKLAIGECA